MQQPINIIAKCYMSTLLVFYHIECNGFGDQLVIQEFLICSGTGKFGSAETELIVRRKVSIVPSIPRFARVGDVFEAGVVVTISGSLRAYPKVSVKLELDDLSRNTLEILKDNEQHVKVGADGNEEVRFKLKAIKVGEASFKVTAGSAWLSLPENLLLLHDS